MAVASSAEMIWERILERGFLVQTKGERMMKVVVEKWMSMNFKHVFIHKRQRCGVCCVIAQWHQS